MGTWALSFMPSFLSGKREGAFVMMHNAVKAGWAGDKTIETAMQMGFRCDVPALREFVKGYVDGHRSK